MSSQGPGVLHIEDSNSLGGIGRYDCLQSRDFNSVRPSLQRQAIPTSTWSCRRVD
jgi:hypothetical protein